QPRVVGQSLLNNGQHSLSSRLSADTGGKSHVLSGRQQCSQQRRSEHSPGVIRLLVPLLDGKRPPAQIQNDSTRGSHRFLVPFDGEWYFRERRTRTAHKSHQRMHGRNRRSLLSQHSKFVAS